MTRLLTILVFLFTICISTFPATAQQPTDVFQQTQQIGRGAVLNAQWHPSGSLILVDTVTGAWLYDNTLADVAHLPDVRLTRFNLDGSIIAGIDAANNVTFWDSTTYTQIDAYAGNTAYVTALEWSPNQSQIATLDHTGRIVVWDLATTAIQFEARLNSETQMYGADQIAWSKNGSYLAAMNLDNAAVGVWDQKGEFVFRTRAEYPGSWNVDMEWRNDSQLVRYIYGELPFSQLWDVATGEDFGTQGIGYTSAYSPDGLTIANGHVNTVTIDDTLTKTVLRRIEIQDSVVYPSILAWSSDSKLLAFGTWSADVTIGSRVFIVDAATGQILNQFDQGAPSTKGIYWSTDNQGLLIVDDANNLSLRDLSGAAIYKNSNSAVHTDIGEMADWARDGSKIVVVDTNLGAHVWETTTGAAFIPPIHIGRPATKAVLQPGGTFLALKSGAMFRWRSEDKNVFIWDISKPIEDNPPAMVIPNLDFVADIAWSPDGKTLAIAEQTQFIRLWSPDEPDIIHVFDLWSIRNTPYIDYTQSLEAIQWSHDSRILDFAYSSSGNGGGVGLLDTQEKKLATGGASRYGSDWAWTNDNRLKWVNWQPYLHGSPPAFNTITLRIGYDPNNPEGTDWSKAVLLSELPQSAAYAVLSPYATKLIGFDVADNAIIWELEPQSVRVRLSGVEDAVWSPDETMLVVYSVDGVLRVIDSTNGETRHTFDDHFNPAPRFASVRSADRLKVFWSPDSRKIALLDRGALYIYEMQG